MHSITGKLNKAARTADNSAGTTFFVSIGEKHYNFKTKENGWTNYDAALFAKGGQIDFYQNALVEGAIISVSGTELIIDTHPDCPAKLVLQNARLGFIHSPDSTSSPAVSETSIQSEYDALETPDEDLPF